MLFVLLSLTKDASPPPPPPLPPPLERLLDDVCISCAEEAADLVVSDAIPLAAVALVSDDDTLLVAPPFSEVVLFAIVEAGQGTLPRKNFSWSTIHLIVVSSEKTSQKLC